MISIIFLGTALRLWGVWNGYPYSYYPDEAHFVKRALSFGSGDLNPHWFHKPAFYMYILFFEYGLFYIVGKISGLWHSVSDFAVFYIKNPGPFYLIGRFTNTVFSIGSIIFTYLTAKELFSRKIGLLAALLLAISFGHVMVAKDIKADTPCMFFTIISTFYLICYMNEKHTKQIILSAAFAGIGAATKYYSMVMLVPIFFALMSNIISWNAKSIAHGLKIFFICIFSFYIIYFMCSPYNFIDPLGRKSTFGRISRIVTEISKVWAQSEGNIAENKGSQNNTHLAKRDSVNFFDGLKSYVSELYKGLGFVIFTVVSLGVLLIPFNFSRALFIFLLFPGFFAFISVYLSPGYAQIRHQIVIYPFLVTFAAIFFINIFNILALRSKACYSLFLIFIFPFYQIINYNIYISKQDTRNIAKNWIEERIAPDSKLLIDEGGPVLYMNKRQIREMLERYNLTDTRSQFTTHYGTFLKYKILAVQDLVTYDLHEIRFPWWRAFEVESGVHRLTTEYDKDMGNPLKPVGVNNFNYYIKSGFEYAVVQSNRYNNFLKETQTAKSFPSFTNFYRELFSKGNLIKEFSPKDGNRPGPTIKIFKFR